MTGHWCCFMLGPCVTGRLCRLLVDFTAHGERQKRRHMDGTVCGGKLLFLGHCTTIFDVNAQEMHVCVVDPIFHVVAGFAVIPALLAIPKREHAQVLGGLPCDRWGSRS